MTTARSLLEAVAGRSPKARALVDALVASVLENELVSLALAVRDADPRFKVRRACELALVVLDGVEEQLPAATA